MARRFSQNGKTCKQIVAYYLQKNLCRVDGAGAICSSRRIHTSVLAANPDCRQEAASSTDQALSPSVRSHTKLPRRTELGSTGKLADRLAQFVLIANAKPTLARCDYVLHLSALTSNVQAARDVMRLMEKRGIAPSVATHSCHLRVLCRGGFIEEAVQRLETLSSAAQGAGPSLPGAAPNIIAYNVVLSSCASNKRADLAHRCLAALHQQGLKMDEMTFTELVKLAGLMQDTEAVHLWWAQLKEALPSHSLSARCDYIVALSRAGALDDVLAELQALCEGSCWQTLGLRPRSKHRRRNPPPGLSPREGKGSPPIDLKSAYPTGRSGPSVSRGAVVSGHGGEPGGCKAPVGPLNAPREVSRAAEADRDEALEELLVAFNAAMSQAARVQDLRIIKKLCVLMESLSLAPDVYTLNAILRAAAKGADVNLAMDVMSAMERGSIRPDARTVLALVQMHCAAGQLDQAEIALHLIGTPTTCHAYNALLDACAMHGDYDRAFRLLQEMLQAKIQADTCTFLALYRACSGVRQAGLESGDWSREDVTRRLDCVEQCMGEAGIRHSHDTLTAVLQVLGEERMLDVMLRHLRTAKGLYGADGNSLVDAVTYNTCINACVQAGRVDMGLNLLEDMREEGVRTNLTTYNTLINGCSFVTGSHLAKAFELADALRKDGLTPDTITWNSLIKVTSHGGELAVALDVLQEMERAGLTPDEFSFHTLMTSAANQGQLDVMEFALEGMHRQGLPPTALTCSTAVTAYVAAKKFPEAEEAMRVLAARMLNASRSLNDSTMHPVFTSTARASPSSKVLNASSGSPIRTSRSESNDKGNSASWLYSGISDTPGLAPESARSDAGLVHGQPVVVAEHASPVEVASQRHGSPGNTSVKLSIRGNRSGPNTEPSLGDDSEYSPSEAADPPASERELLLAAAAGEREATALYLARLAASVGSQPMVSFVDASPWAVRLRLQYDRQRKR